MKGNREEKGEGEGGERKKKKKRNQEEGFKKACGGRTRARANHTK